MEQQIDDSHIPYFGTTYIPNVVFLGENDEEYRFDVVAAAAPDVRQHTNEYKSFFRDATTEEMKAVILKKVEAVMASCVANNVSVLIAGAFGCGVYRCDSVMVAQSFKEAIRLPKFKNKGIRKVVFAIAYNDVKLQLFRETIM